MADIRTPEARLSFPYITEQKTDKKSGEKKGYGVSLLIPKDGKGTPEFLKALRGLVKESIQSKFGDNIPNKLRGEYKANKAYPMRDGDDATNFETHREEYKGHYVATLNAGKQPPGCLVRKFGTRALSKEEIETEFYAGCYVIATLNTYAYDNESKGVAIGLQNLIKMREGVPFGAARTAAADDFGDLLDGDVDDEDLDDEDFDEDDDI